MPNATSTATARANPIAKFTEEPVVWVHRWNAGLMSFRVRRNLAYQFQPGQFARIGIRKEDGEIIWRAY